VQKILIVEDDDLIAELVVRVLSRQDYSVDVASDGTVGYRMACDNSYDLLILDIMLPNKNGLEICRDIRSKNDKTPILFLSARNSETSKVQGLDMGADDYLVKPFGYKELIARTNALLRRPLQSYSSSLKIGDLELNSNGSSVTYNGHDLMLRKKEFELLQYLMQRPDKIISKKELLNNIWGVSPDTSSNRLEACMKNLRKAFDGIACNESNFEIQTVRNMGYRIRQTS